MRPLRFLLLLLVSLSLVAGCSRRPEGHRRVRGVIQLPGGEPLSGLKGASVIRFDSVNPETREEYESIGMLEEDGSFEVMTYSGGDGVPLGEYKVVLNMEKYPENFKIVPDPYTHYETTPWRATVEADGKNYFTLQISDDPPKTKDDSK